MAVRSNILHTQNVHIRDHHNSERAHHSHVYIRALAAYLQGHLRQKVLQRLLARPQDYHLYLDSVRSPCPAIFVHLGRLF